MSKEHFDTETPNKSFLRLYSVLKQMGVQNNKFFLILLDTELSGVDPYNLRDNSMELKLRIVREAKLNPWFFFRVLLRVPAAGTNGTQFILSRANLAMIWLFFNHIDNMLIMPRQLGKTIGSIGITASIIYLLGENITFAMLTKDSKLRKENVERLADMRDAFPDWFIHKQRSDADNTEEIGYKVLNNKYSTYVAQLSETGAEKLGRGMTVPSQHWDEPAYFANIGLTYPSAISATNSAIDSARANNQPYGNILTTTAGKLNTPEGRFTHNLICNSLTFTERLYDLKDVEELNSVVRSNSRQRMVYCEFSYLQLGKTEEWFQDVTARTTGDDDIIDRDYLNKWTFGTMKGPIDKVLLDKLYKGKQDPEYVQFVEDFCIKWYIPKASVKSPSIFGAIPIVLGMDASENVGRDYTSFVFTDGRDMSTVATCSCNTTNIIKVAMFVCKWLMNDNFLFIPERNSVGCAIIDYCLLKLDQMGINPFYRIYNTIVQNFGIGGSKISRAELARSGFYNEHRKAFGFRTSGESRPFLYKTVFGRVMEVACQNVRDISLINQIAGLTVKNGRIDHGSGGNDDSVIAYILTGFLLFFGENIDMYDFCKGRTEILLKNISGVSEEEDGNNIDTTDIEQLKLVVNRLERGVRYENNPTLRVEALHKINELKSKIPKEDDDALSDAASLTQLKAKKLTLNEVSSGDKAAYVARYLSGF